MLAVITVVAVTIVILVILLARDSRLNLPEKSKILALALIVALSTHYYLLTIGAGKGAETVGKWGVGIQNLAFATYELLGFTGFGPGRYKLREAGLQGGLDGGIQAIAESPLAGGVFFLLVLYALLFIELIRKIRSTEAIHRHLLLPATAVVLLSVGTLFSLSVYADFPFWGRHLAPSLPMLLLVLAIAAGSDHHYHKRKVILSTGFCATLFVSSMFVRFDPTHNRDDYRSAVASAGAAVSAGKTVWWSASPMPAEYYRLTICDLADTDLQGCVVNAINRIESQISKLPMPNLVFVSKPDLFDIDGSLRRFLRTNDFEVQQQFSAFVVYSRR
jgi:hypothetical protein